MFCKNCGNELTGSEVFCPKCGFQNAAQAETEQAQPDFSAQQSGTCPVCGNPVNPTATFCTTCGATLNGAADSSMNNSMNNGTNYGSDFGYSEPPKKKRKKAPFIIGGAAAVVLIAGGICIANAASLGNFIKRTFSSPESYYQSVGKEALSDAAESFGDSYDTYLKRMEESKSGGSVDLTLRLEEGGRSLLGTIAPMDISWLNEISLKVNSQMDGASSQGALEFYLNDDKLASMQIAADLDLEELYMKVPELSSEYLGMDLAQIAAESGMSVEMTTEMSQMFTDLSKYCEDGDTVAALMERYGNIIFDNIDSVEKSSGTLEAPGVSQKCTVLRAELDAEDMTNIANDVLDELSSDKDIEKIIRAFADTAQTMSPDDTSLDGDSMYQEFLAQIDSMRSDIENMPLEGTDAALINELSVDNSGKIIGCSFSAFEDGTETPVFNYSRAQDGKDFGMMTVISSGSSAFDIRGTGTISGSKESGTYTISMDDSPLLAVAVDDYDIKAARNGKAEGSFTITPQAGLLSMMGSEDFSMILNYSLKATFSSSDKTTQTDLTLMSSETPLVTLALGSSNETEAVDAFPADSDTVYNMMDETELMNYIINADWQGFADILNNSDIPAEYLTEINSMIQSLQEDLAYYNEYSSEY